MPWTHSDGWMLGPQVILPKQQVSGGDDLQEDLVGGALDTPADAALPSGMSASPFELSFETPLEEVLALSTEAFGQMASSLSSPKWDRRVQALKGVGTLLKGLDIQANPQKNSGRGLQLSDHARCFRAACLVLHIVMRDKVLPVMFAAHELYHIVFESSHWAVSEDESGFAMGVLLQHLLQKLGELNIRLHESACSAVVFSAERPFFGLGRTLSRLRAHLDDRVAGFRGQQRLRSQGGVLDVVGQLLRQFPGHRAAGATSANPVGSWSVADVSPFIANGVAADGVTGLRIQQAATNIAVIVAETLGRQALDPVLAELTPAGKEMLLARLDEDGDGMPEDGEGCEDDDGGDAIELAGDGLCIFGVGLKPPPSGVQTATLMDQYEESIMDNILEETGLVFEGQGLKSAARGNLGSNLGSVLDEDLRGLGLDGLLS